MQAAKKALERAKIQLMTRPDSVFFTQVCFALKHIFTDDIPTAATNGTYIKFNPTFFMSLDADEQLFLILHETLHVALLHMLRGEHLDAQKFNMAADYVINDMLIQRGYKMPKCGLHDVQYRGMSTRQVYDLLPDNPSNTGWDDLVAPDGTDGTDGKSAASQAAKEAITDIIVRASIQSKIQGDKAGTIPGDIQVYLDGLLTPKLPTRVILKRYMSAMAKNDYTWRKPSRRFFPDHHLPSLYSETLDEIAVAMDLSGSVSDAEIKRTVSEIDPILRHMKPKKLHLLQFDTALKEINVLRTPAELAKVKLHGRGGTLISPVIDWAKEHKPKVIMIFTDGGFNFYDSTPPGCEVVWLIHGNPQWTAPYGKVIHYDI